MYTKPVNALQIHSIPYTVPVHVQTSFDSLNEHQPILTVHMYVKPVLTAQMYAKLVFTVQMYTKPTITIQIYTKPVITIQMYTKPGFNEQVYITSIDHINVHKTSFIMLQ